MQAKVGYHKRSYQKKDKEGIQGRFYVRRPEKYPADHRDYYRCQNHQGHNISQKEQNAVGDSSQKSKGEERKDTGNEELCVDKNQNHKSPEKKEVVDSKLLAHHTKLNKGVKDHPSETRPEMVKSVLPPSQANHGKEPKDIS
jgi:hypothetical protein